MEYFYNDGYHSHGPFTLEELLKKNINTDSWINVRGTNDWVKASEIESLKGKITPPIKPIKKQTSSSNTSSNYRKTTPPTRLNQEAVKKQLEADYIKKKEKVVIEIIDLDSRKKVKEHLIPSVLSLFGLTVLGIIALIKSASIKGLVMGNNLDEARRVSRLTRRLSYCGIFFAYGLFLWMLTAGSFVSSITSIIQSIDRPYRFYY